MNKPRWFEDPSADLKEIVPGIYFISAPGHGGYRLSPERLNQMHPSLRKRNTEYAPLRYFEEDCEAALVALAFRHLAAFEAWANVAEDQVRAIYPEQYAEWKS